MKLTVEKVPEGVRVELTLGVAKRPPLVVTLAPGQVSTLVQVLQAAVRADSLKLTLEYQE